jgi:hypothetical protein
MMDSDFKKNTVVPISLANYKRRCLQDARQNGSFDTGHVPGGPKIWLIQSIFLQLSILPKPVKKLPAFYVNRMFMTVFTRACQ